MTVHEFFVDFALASLLILAGQLLRSKITFFQRFFMPASMIAGFLGLILGPSVLDILPFSDSVSSYAGILIILIFTIVGVNGFELGGGEEAGEGKRILGFQLYRLIAFFVQFIIPIALTMLVFVRIFPQLNDSFGTLLVSGFYGGHGTAVAVGDTLVNLGWADAQDLAVTFATVGILTGVFGGLILIKLATKKGETGYIKDFKYISGDMKTGLVKKENRGSMGQETISSVSLDTLAFHLSIVLGISGLSYLLNVWIANNFVSGIPDFTIAYVIALIFFLIFRNTGVYEYVDKDINDRISGTATDYLVFFGIAAVSLEVVVQYAVPLIIMSLVGIAIVVFMLYPLGKAFNKDSWFERSIFIYGYSTGVFAIGFILLRIVDPENKSKTVSDTALTPLTSFVEIIMWSTVPAALISGQGWLVVGILTLATIGCFIIAKVSGAWWLGIPNGERTTIGVESKSNN